MDPWKEEMSLFWVISCLLPIGVTALSWKYGSGGVALALWLAMSVAYYAWKRPWHTDRPLYQNLIYLLAVIVYGPIFATIEILKKFFPKLANF